MAVLKKMNGCDRMAQAADQAAQSAASDGAANLSGQRSPLLLATKKTGEAQMISSTKPAPKSKTHFFKERKGIKGDE